MTAPKNSGATQRKSSWQGRFNSLLFNDILVCCERKIYNNQMNKERLNKNKGWDFILGVPFFSREMRHDFPEAFQSRHVLKCEDSQSGVLAACQLGCWIFSLDQRKRVAYPPKERWRRCTFLENTTGDVLDGACPLRHLLFWSFTIWIFFFHLQTHKIYVYIHIRIPCSAV